MERVVVVGNCQARALEMILATCDGFVRRFTFSQFPPIHEIPEEVIPELHRAVADATVVIPQRVAEDYRGGVGLGTESLAARASRATVVRWPSVYWAGYFPELFYLRDEQAQPVVDGPFDYHDRTILRAYADGLSVASTCLLLEDPEYPSEALTWAAQASAELSVRGQDCDVDVTSFINSRFRDKLLFFTMNHPSNRLLAHLAQQILDTLGIAGCVDLSELPGELLGSTFYPIHANHAGALDLGFADELAAGKTPFRIRGTSYEASEAVSAFFDYYDANPRLVRLNLNLTGG